ncbi:ubiquitin/ISG15-conjugating enzyme E2 L6 [Echinops telfairi]|uniref:Ubiquitin/ISG15-conjugating enzyme E2 L6 n=2 Tax=Echinops telfairi TaxID=9371 RepID=A0AC55DMN7_ECHTE|nr:ubiquitin/ISG15-conjugating enzyme E2 L6 [Echinops telfairi]XP_045153000.1 ubiquitin/ISG15-conjugating enzyme E2 L6 [Echinops telfairi]
MSAYKRVAKELEDLQGSLPCYLRNLVSEPDNILVWHMLLLPSEPPYNLKAFNVSLIFPEDYPFKPPKIRFTTKIYHPNVEESGQVCLPITSNENWKPCTKTRQVLEALNMMVNQPDLGQPLRIELAEMLTQNRKQFYQSAQKFTLSYGVPRPT